MLFGMKAMEWKKGVLETSHPPHEPDGRSFVTFLGHLDQQTQASLPAWHRPSLGSYQVSLPPAAPLSYSTFLLPQWPWTISLTSPCLCFLLHKSGMIKSTSESCSELNVVTCRRAAHNWFTAQHSMNRLTALSSSAFVAILLSVRFSRAWRCAFPSFLATLEFSTCHCHFVSCRCNSCFPVIATLGGEIEDRDRGPVPPWFPSSEIIAWNLDRISAWTGCEAVGDAWLKAVCTFLTGEKSSNYLPFQWGDLHTVSRGKDRESDKKRRGQHLCSPITTENTQSPRAKHVFFLSKFIKWYSHIYLYIASLNPLKMFKFK